eukprot:481111-Pleurochrysis_carterae.AAC.1
MTSGALRDGTDNDYCFSASASAAIRPQPKSVSSRASHYSKVCRIGLEALLHFVNHAQRRTSLPMSASALARGHR